MKYLITQEQVTRLQDLADAFELVSIQGLIDELKPIEPLSDAEILRYVYCTPHEGKHYIKFARAVETHILGENT